MDPWLLAPAGAALLILALALKLRGGGRGHLLGPPRPKPRHLPHAELDRLTELVGRGGEEEVLRHLKAAGYGGRRASRLVRLMARLAAADRAAAGKE
ncbi:MAG TPA: hypothetical protein VF782_12255 [Allosphingosinicella sp.]|jgi:integrase